jgi:hypothetical protein
LDLPVAPRVVERVAVFVVDVFSVTFTYLPGFDHVPSGFVSGNPFGHLFWTLLIFSLGSFFSFSCSGHYSPLGGVFRRVGCNDLIISVSC